jgi:hypothetical protein
VDQDVVLAFFRKLVLASAPLMITGCGPSGPFSTPCPTQEATLSIASLQGDAALPDAGGADGGLADLCQHAFPGDYIDSCMPVTSDGGEAVHIVYTLDCHTGRRPAGLASSAGQARTSPLGAWLAHVTHLEAASVCAFRMLADELGMFGAPSILIGAARAAATDERRHAGLMARLAVSAGARPPAVRVTPTAARDLETVARENAVEGCVRETFGALVAWRQSRLADDLAIRDTMRTIAADETRHAALSWAIDAWSRDRLSKRARRRVCAARSEAISVLLRTVAVSEASALRLPAGLPDGTEAGNMASALFAHIA